ncbi:Group II intron-encoded protein LtrA [Gimesia panareensis]|uniref:RNA-directed DNA polymerase n=1 Tax=Gimesia panareensis TaxID=2527978 RepID=A0A517QAN2_9PLAN|nr:Group II intron-encoded protein LtrA [Gimesia panareensis]
MFADNSKESEAAPKADVSAGRSYLLHQADHNLTNETDAPIEDRDANHDRLLERVASLSNLARALLFVARNKGAAGVDGVSTEEVVEAAPDLLPEIRHALISGTYMPGDIRRVWIPKPGGGERGLGIPNVIDRLVQQAVLLQLEPIFEPTFHDSSHGFRRYRGAQTAIAEAKGYFNKGYGITVDIDLSKFFDRVHHQRLLGRISQRVEDGRVLKLVHRMLKAKVVMPDGTCVVSEEGTPQGGPLSPLLSNIVLDELDWELTRRGLKFVRYADDFSVFVRTKRAGDRVMASVQQFIERKLRLVINEEKSSVSAPFDLTFLGFRLRKDSKGIMMILISNRTARRMSVRIRELTPRNWGGSFDACVARVNRYLNGWIGYFRLCTGVGSFSGFDAHIRRRLRAILVRQKKRPRHLFRHLLRRGISQGLAWKSAYRIRGHWKRSASFGIHKAYGNAWFAERLVNLQIRWHEFHPKGAKKQLELF